jgi:hypothetical protein
MGTSGIGALLACACALLGGGLALTARTWALVRAVSRADTAERLEALRRELAELKRMVEPRPERRGARAGARAHRAHRAAETAIAGPTLIAVPNLAGSPGKAAPVAEELNRRFGPIWALAEAGLSADAIAVRSGQPVGQVELILGLRRQLDAPSPAHPSPSPGNRN